MRRIDSILGLVLIRLPRNIIIILFLLITIFSWAPDMKGSSEKSEHPTYTINNDLKLLNMGKSILGFKLDSTTINEIRKKMGMAEISKGGKHEPNRLCYVSSVPQDNTVLEFESDILGDKNILWGFALYSNKPNHLFSKNCMPSPLVHKNINTLGSIHLNLDMEFVKSILGNPTHEDSNIVRYRQKFKVPWSDDMYKGYNRPVPKENERNHYDVYIDIFGKFEEGKLTVFKISENSYM